MNYSLGFMFIHLLHFTVATKQPAMTASHIAAELHSKDGRNIDIDSMAELCNRVIRTQNMAVLGNLATAIPTAWLIAYSWPYLTGQPLITPDKAMHLLHDIDPFNAYTLLYAAIAGVCLFLAGLISGYYDNKALYTRWANRIMQLRTLERVIGAPRLARLGHYLENNLGGLMGNFYFGVLLGVMPLLGFLLGLPLDIRHVTFSSANFATAMVALDHQASWQLVLTSIAGFLAIGTIDLLVSFGLALWVALRARQARFRHGWQLLGALLKRWRQGPIRFFFGGAELTMPRVRWNGGLIVALLCICWCAACASLPAPAPATAPAATPSIQGAQGALSTTRARALLAKRWPQGRLDPATQALPEQQATG
eukprot:gene23445-23476_t